MKMRLGTIHSPVGRAAFVIWEVIAVETRIGCMNPPDGAAHACCQALAEAAR